MIQAKGDDAHSLPLLTNVSKGAGASSLLVLASKTMGNGTYSLQLVNRDRRSKLKVW